MNKYLKGERKKSFIENCNLKKVNPKHKEKKASDGKKEQRESIKKRITK